MTAYDGPILFFDGQCNLCNRAVQFIIRHDWHGKIKFAPLQSAPGEEAQQAVRTALGKVPDALLFYRNGKYYAASDAALEAASLLDGRWKWLTLLKIFPLRLRDWVYAGIAKKRFIWFGRRDTCMIPTPEISRRFLS